MMMAEVVTAEELFDTVAKLAELTRKPGGTQLPFCSKAHVMPSVRDLLTAIREAAKLELLAELRAMASEDRFDIIQSNTICYVASELRAKHTPATETQPAQDGERR